MRFSIHGCVAVLIIAGCDRPVGAPATVVRDTAGATLVETTLPDSIRTACTLSPEPTLVIRHQPGAGGHDLFSPAHPIRLSDGRIVVVDRTTARINWFDSTGKLVTSAGRKGQGPGEFELITALAKLPGDSLLTSDLSRPPSVFDPAGRFVRVSRLPASRVVGTLDDGTILMSIAGPPMTGMSVGRDTNHYAVMSSAGDTAYVFAFLGGERVRTVSRRPDGGISGSSLVVNPFARSPETIARGDAVYYADGGPLEAHEYSTGGALRRIHRIAVPRRKITQSDIDSVVAARRSRIARSPSAGARARYEASLEAMEFPEFRAELVEMHVDAARRIWMRRLRLPDDPTPAGRFLVLAPDGELLGQCITPERLTIAEIGRDYLLGIRSNDDDESEVVMYRLRATMPD